MIERKTPENAPVIEAMAFYDKKLAEARAKREANEKRKKDAEKAAEEIAAANPNAWIDKKAVAKRIERAEDDMAATAEKQKGMALGAKNHGDILAAAQAVARKLAENGAVTIDDVVHEMRKQGYKEVDPGSKDAPKNWKGSVFTDSDWVCVGSIASREKSAHGRQVRQWVLRGWLKNHPVNGTGNEASAFCLFEIYQEAANHYPAGTELVLLVGKEMLDSSFQKAIGEAIKFAPDGTVLCSQKTLFGCKLFPFNGVGAICIPRRALEESLTKASTLNKWTP